VPYLSQSDIVIIEREVHAFTPTMTPLLFDLLDDTHSTQQNYFPVKVKNSNDIRTDQQQ